MGSFLKAARYISVRIGASPNVAGLRARDMMDGLMRVEMSFERDVFRFDREGRIMSNF